MLLCALWRRDDGLCGLAAVLFLRVLLVPGYGQAFLAAFQLFTLGEVLAGCCRKSVLLQRAWLVRSRVLALLLLTRLQCMRRKSRVLAVLLLLPLHRLPAQQTLRQWLRRMLRQA